MLMVERGRIVISEHARFEMERRQISEDSAMDVAERPQQLIGAGEGRYVYQSRYFDAVEGKEMLLRLVVERREADFYLITAYKTSKLEKYWREAQQ